MNQPATAPPEVMTLEFLPLHKGAFGIATGTAAALLIFVATLATALSTSEPKPPLHLLGQYFAGYHVTVSGAFIGAAWGAFTGFVMGWFLAFSRLQMPLELRLNNVLHCLLDQQLNKSDKTFYLQASFFAAWRLLFACMQPDLNNQELVYTLKLVQRLPILFFY